MGDDDQSIYGWRGATLTTSAPAAGLPAAQGGQLGTNYRSTSAICRRNNQLISANPKLYAKTLFSQLGEGEPVRVVDADHEGARG